MNMNWKFWTWARQIRVLKLALATANKDIAHLKAALAGEQQRRQEIEVRWRGMHRNHHA